MTICCEIKARCPTFGGNLHAERDNSLSPTNRGPAQKLVPHKRRLILKTTTTPKKWLESTN